MRYLFYQFITTQKICATQNLAAYQLQAAMNQNKVMANTLQPAGGPLHSLPLLAGPAGSQSSLVSQVKINSLAPGRCGNNF